MIRGRKPKPIELRLVGGNAGHRAIPSPDDIAKVEGEPEMPLDFEGAHAAEWDRIVSDLREAGTLSREISASIEIYVRSLVRMREAERHVTEYGAIVQAPRTGVPMQNPYLAIANRAAKDVARMAAELGLTPSSRSRVSKVGGPKKTNPFLDP